MTVREALLALLSEGPLHGYQLKTDFDAAMGEAWPLNIGQVYTTLQRLERDDLVETEGEVNEEGRRPYALTAAGREELTRWIQGTVVQPLASRDEVSMKVLIAIATGVASSLDVVSAQRTTTMSTLQSLTLVKSDAGSAPLAMRLHIDRMVMLAEAEVRWLDLVEDRLVAEGAKHATRVGATAASEDPELTPLSESPTK